MSGLELDTPAQQRLATELLAWGQPRPRVREDFLAELTASMERELAELSAGLVRATELDARRRVLITKTRLDRLVCDGLALDAEPFTYTWASMRGILAHSVIERDWREQREREPAELVEDVWHDEASRRAGDPSSASAWMNAQSSEDAAALRAELVGLLEGFREVWPTIPDDVVDAQLERSYEVGLMDGAVSLFGRPDIVLTSRRSDGHARTLVVDLKSGRPRPEHDRHELRFYALLVALATGTPPFRWATFYVTEGRYEVEDLREATLQATARRVVDGVRQQVRIAGREPGATDDDLVIRGGSWCGFCQREPDCPEAARARMSQDDGMLEA